MVSRAQKKLQDFWGVSQIDYFDIITDIDSPEVLRKVLEEILNRYKGYDVFFSHFEERGALYACLGNVPDISKETCVNIILNRYNNYDDYFQSLSKHQRQNLRTAYNKLAKENIDWHVKEYDQSSPVPPQTFEALFNFYEKRRMMKEDRKLDTLRYYIKRKASHVNYVIRGLDSSSIHVLFFGDVPVAFAGGYYKEDRTVIYIPKLSTHVKYLKYSTGIILVNEMIKRFILNGVEVFDLTRGNEPYKYIMGGVEHYTFSLRMQA